MTEEERRRCILLGACNPDQQAAVTASVTATTATTSAAPCPASTLADMLTSEGAMHDLKAACKAVLARLGLPVQPRAA